MIKISSEKWACRLFTWCMREMRGRRRGRLGRHWGCQLCCNGNHTHTRTLGYNTERQLSHTCQGYSVVVEKAKGRRKSFFSSFLRAEGQSKSSKIESEGRFWEMKYAWWEMMGRGLKSVLFIHFMLIIKWIIKALN